MTLPSNDQTVVASIDQSTKDAMANQSINQYTPLNDLNYLSELGARREPSALRALVPIMAIPGMISLGGGLPNPKMFPFKSMKITVDVGQANEQSDDQSNNQFDIVIDENDAEGMSDAFQYSATFGVPALTKQLKYLQSREHIEPFQSNNQYLSNGDNWNVLVTVGSQDGIAKTFEMLFNTSYTHSFAGNQTINQSITQQVLLTETPTYSGALSIVRPMGVKVIGVETDKHGIIPESLKELLDNWETHSLAHSTNQSIQLIKPKVLYLIPNGQNPSGTTMTLERKRAVYDICCQHDMIILEDDPYAYLTYGEKRVTPVKQSNTQIDQSMNSPFVRPRVPSLFSLDTQGRVLRFDSLSKILSSGLRIGFVTGPASFVTRLMLSAQCSSLHAAGVSQVIAAKYLQKLGSAGWQQHVDRVSLFYAKRRDFLCDLLDLHLSNLIEYNRPSAGMFVWLKCKNVADSKKLIEEKARKALVLLVPGQVFIPDDSQTSYVRASFSLASESDMEIAVQRLVIILKEEAKERGDEHLLQ